MYLVSDGPAMKVHYISNEPAKFQITCKQAASCRFQRTGRTDNYLVSSLKLGNDRIRIKNISFQVQNYVP